jgi:hypothetical protein
VEGLGEQFGQFDCKRPLLRRIQTSVCLNNDKRHLHNGAVGNKGAVRATEPFSQRLFDCSGMLMIHIQYVSQ